jgi:hypothetical protein
MYKFYHDIFFIFFITAYIDRILQESLNNMYIDGRLCVCILANILVCSLFDNTYIIYIL